MRPRSRNILVGTTTVAFCASLTLHALVVVAAIDLYSNAKIFLPGIDRTQLTGSNSDRILIPLPEAIPPEANAPEPHPDEQLGRADGTGSAIDDSSGELPMLARKGPQDQALLSRDPAGPGQLHSVLSDSVRPPVSSRRNATVAMAPVPPPANLSESREAQKAVAEQQAVEESNESLAERAIPFGVGVIDEQPNDVPIDRPATFARTTQPAHTAQPELDAVASTAAPVVPAPPVPGQPGTPGAPNSSADAAPQSDTESDPFTVIGAAQFRSGGTRAQLGRAHRLSYPRIGISGLVDSVQRGRAKLVLQITIDQTGQVKQATIFKSSGSENTDQACRITAYEWWFEPKKGRDGEAMKEETFLFLILFA